VIAVVRATAEEVATQPPNPILPVFNEIFYTVVAFALLAILIRIAFPKVAGPMDARAESVRADLAEAERSKGEVDAVLSQYQAQLAEARGQANSIIEEARRGFEAERSAALASVNADIAQQKAAAVADVDAAKQRAMVSLQGSVADLAADAAGRVLGRPVDAAVAQAAVAGVLAGGAS
jgi:F-type H+-transporting ATPase subunit b